MEGNGIIYLGSDYKYIGQIEDGKMYGDGIIFDQKDEIEYQGKCNDDVYHSIFKNNK